MAQEKVDPVRTPLRVRERSGRTLDQRLALWLPRASRLARRWGSRLPPNSRLRRASLPRTVALRYEAFNRRDLEAALINYHPDLELLPPRRMIESGIVESSYHGHDGYRSFFSVWLGVWGAYQGVPQELFDLGDHLLTLGYLEARGESSGVASRRSTPR
jgi:hypothetical protein